ncbi:site-specific recombinase, phage integrase [Mycobacteroides abscessus subsp. bolletii]|nr:site-specific recombinase%2C phage integrase [Mycobacteroides abscessus]SKF44212.1 site-specific recombinase, phage integrase [Mycobacteroides abscessus subsp. bolletii]SKH16378.1 site-specific recombinase, phage integrase [Mycobacteroides abscessus subsp. bolletii]
MRVETGSGAGKRKQGRKRFRALADAVAYYTGTKSDRSRGTHVAPQDLTVQQAVEEWLDSQRLRPKTLSSYTTNVRPLVDHLGDRPVQQVTKGDIEAMVRALRVGASPMGTWRGATKLKGKETRGPWGASSINPCLARAKSVFGDLVDQGILARNVAALVKPIPRTKSEMQTLTAKQVAHLLKSTAGDDMHIAWRLALSGLRRGEILGLSWTAVDFRSNTLSVEASRLPVAGGSETSGTKTEGSERELPMPAPLAAALKAEKTRQKERQIFLGQEWPSSGLVVVDHLGRPPHPDSLGRWWGKALETAKLPHVRLHDARHSCATIMHLDGVPIAVIAAWLGHTDPAFTMSVYGHSQNDALKSAAQRLGSITSEVPDAAES